MQPNNNHHAIPPHHHHQLSDHKEHSISELSWGKMFLRMNETWEIWNYKWARGNPGQQMLSKLYFLTEGQVSVDQYKLSGAHYVTAMVFSVSYTSLYWVK